MTRIFAIPAMRCPLGSGMPMTDHTLEPLLQTPLHPAHVALGARMVPFAGYDMPVQYSTGVLSEHLWTRASAGLFDVSHMGQAFFVGPDWETTARAIEALVPADVCPDGSGIFCYIAPNQGNVLAVNGMIEKFFGQGGNCFFGFGQHH